jgi:hypothetical protein
VLTPEEIETLNGIITGPEGYDVNDMYEETYKEVFAVDDDLTPERADSEDFWHEVQDRVYVQSDTFESFITTHPAILTDKRLYRMAVLAQGLMLRLYQECGQKCCEAADRVPRLKIFESNN